MLQTTSLSCWYGGKQALADVNLEVRAGEFVVVVGPNGAGKTTLLRAISGLVKTTGSIRFHDTDLTGLEPHERARAGIAHVPQQSQVFPSLSVQENLLIGAFSRVHGKEREALCQDMFALFPALYNQRTSLAGSLSGGQRQMLAIARGLMSRPDVILLDEPSAGLSPLMMESVFGQVAALHKERGLTVLMVEQRVAEALEICDRAYVLAEGRNRLNGTRSELMGQQMVVDAILGLS